MAYAAANSLGNLTVESNVTTSGCPRSPSQAHEFLVGSDNCRFCGTGRDAVHAAGHPYKVIPNGDPNAVPGFHSLPDEEPPLELPGVPTGVDVLFVGMRLRSTVVCYLRETHVSGQSPAVKRKAEVVMDGQHIAIACVRLFRDEFGSRLQVDERIYNDQGKLDVKGWCAYSSERGLTDGLEDLIGERNRSWFPAEAADPGEPLPVTKVAWCPKCMNDGVAKVVGCAGLDVEKMRKRHVQIFNLGLKSGMTREEFKIFTAQQPKCRTCRGDFIRKHEDAPKSWPRRG